MSEILIMFSVTKSSFVILDSGVWLLWKWGWKCMSGCLQIKEITCICYLENEEHAGIDLFGIRENHVKSTCIFKKFWKSIAWVGSSRDARNAGRGSLLANQTERPTSLFRLMEYEFKHQPDSRNHALQTFGQLEEWISTAIKEVMRFKLRPASIARHSSASSNYSKNIWWDTARVLNLREEEGLMRPIRGTCSR